MNAEFNGKSGSWAIQKNGQVKSMRQTSGPTGALAMARPLTPSFSRGQAGKLGARERLDYKASKKQPNATETNNCLFRMLFAIDDVKHRFLRNAIF